MVKEEAIRAALRKIDGISKFMTRGEVKLLPEILGESELPEGIIAGVFENRNGVVVATNIRAIFIDKGMMTMKVEGFPYDQITSIEHTIGLLFGAITIYTAGNKTSIVQVDKSRVRHFAELISERIANQKSAVPAAAPQEDRMVRLKRIAELRDQGILTDAEFETEKQRILNR